MSKRLEAAATFVGLFVLSMFFLGRSIQAQTFYSLPSPWAIVAKTTSFTPSVSDGPRVIYQIDASGGNVTVTLPSPSVMSPGLAHYIFSRTDTSVLTTLVVNPVSGLINGLTGLTILGSNTSAVVNSTTAWVKAQ